MKWSDIEKLVPEDGRQPDFQACLEAFPALEFAKTAPQDPEHGSAPLDHTTELVCL